jgi:hypothetical protein
LKSVGNFSNIMKTSHLLEDNQKIKAPTRDYTEIDLSKENAFKGARKEELQRPTFTNKVLEQSSGSGSNFKALDTQGDVILIINYILFSYI